MDGSSIDINKVVSLTFDESPKVRKEAARVLAEIDDPAAIFALMELSYDKDIAVKKLAQDLLEKKKSSSQDVMSFAEIFSKGTPVSTLEGDQKLAAENSSRARLLEPITRIFERKLGKERAHAVKNRMMPAIEKIYMKTVGTKPSANKSEDNESGRKTMQEFLTSYLEAISGFPEMPHREQEEEEGNREHVRQQDRDKREHLPQNHVLQPSIAEEIGEVSTKPSEIFHVQKDIAELEKLEVAEEKQEEALEALPKSIFQKAYESMLASAGDEGTMKRDMKKLLRETERDIKSAYNFARRRFKENNLPLLSKLKEGMRNVNTGILTVKEIGNFTYQKGKETKPVVRLLLSDEEGNEGILYFFDGRGTAIRQGMHIKVLGAHARKFDFSSELAMAITPKGNVFIIL